MATVAFRPEILQSPALLADFLNGNEESAAIIRAAQNPSASQLADRWDTACLSEVKETYHLLYAFVLTVLSYALHNLCMPDLSKRLWVLSRHEQSNGTIIKTEKFFQEHFLARSINYYRNDTADFYLQSPLLLNLSSQSATLLEFFHDKGLCRGMSLWFVYLYFKTQNHFSNPQEHLRALGTQFEQGASRQAAFLHSMKTPSSNYDLLNLNTQIDYLKINPRGKTHEQIIGEMQHCIPGVYGVYTGTHQLVYIKHQDGRQFLFDPNKGIFEVDSLALFKKAMERYFNTHDNAPKILIDRYTPR